LPHGSGSAARDLVRLNKLISRFFKEVVLVFDQDEAGKAAVADVMAIMPDAIVATLPSKTPTIALEGRVKAAYGACVFNAQKPKNSRIVSVQALCTKRLR
jgi:twinkle protein